MTDQSSKSTPERLRKLSDEVERIASALARMSTEDSLGAEARPSGASGEAEISPETVRLTIRARRLRGRYFPGELFADPAWDMMLELLLAELTYQRVSISALQAAAGVPPTTALRWLNHMVQTGLMFRRADPLDARRVFVELAPETSVGLRKYFRDVT